MPREHTFVARPPRCRVEHCDRDASGGRGLCQSCYQQVWQAVHSGQYTWEELERRHKVLPVVSVKQWLEK
jgi:hypothetical protein